MGIKVETNLDQKTKDHPWTLFCATPPGNKPHNFVSERGSALMTKTKFPFSWWDGSSELDLGLFKRSK